MALTEGTRIIVAACPDIGIFMTTSEAVSQGDLLGIDSNGYVFPVDSDDGEQGRLVAGSGGASGATIQCYWMAVIDGFTGGTEAAAIYPSTTAGSYTETADTTGSDTNTIVGYVMTETMIMVMPGVRADSTA